MATKFEELNVDTLKSVAEMFAVDLDGVTKKADIIKELEENGVDFKSYQAQLLPTEDEEEVVSVVEDGPVQEDDEDEEEEKVLVKMTRRNGTYEIRGYRFTKNNPYALVKESDADYLIENGGGFRTASPKELREFYAK